MSANERLSELIFAELQCRRPMTAAQIGKAIRRHAKVKTDTRSVTAVLMAHPHRFMRGGRRFLQRSWRWQLVEAGPAQDPGTSGAPVPARPRRHELSRGAAALLTFREDEPPTNAVGRQA